MRSKGSFEKSPERGGYGVGFLLSRAIVAELVERSLSRNGKLEYLWTKAGYNIV